MSEPPLNVPSHQRKCCVQCCTSQATTWVGPANSNGLDDYTEVCDSHVEDVKREDDVTAPL